MAILHGPSNAGSSGYLSLISQITRVFDTAHSCPSPPLELEVLHTSNKNLHI